MIPNAAPIHVRRQVFYPQPLAQIVIGTFSNFLRYLFHAYLPQRNTARQAATRAKMGAGKTGGGRVLRTQGKDFFGFSQQIFFHVVAWAFGR